MSFDQSSVLRRRNLGKSSGVELSKAFSDFRSMAATGLRPTGWGVVESVVGGALVCHRAGSHQDMDLRSLVHASLFIRSLARLWVDKMSREGSRATEPGELSKVMVEDGAGSPATTRVAALTGQYPAADAPGGLLACGVGASLTTSGASTGRLAAGWGGCTTRRPMSNLPRHSPAAGSASPHMLRGVGHDCRSVSPLFKTPRYALASRRMKRSTISHHPLAVGWADMFDRCPVPPSERVPILCRV